MSSILKVQRPQTNLGLNFLPVRTADAWIRASMPSRGRARAWRRAPARWCSTASMPTACAAVVDEPEFGLLREMDPDVVGAWRRMGSSAVFSGDEELIGQMKRAGSAVRSDDWTQAKLAVLELLWALSRRDCSLAKPQTLLAPMQLRMAKTAHDLIESAPAQPHDARDMAFDMGVSATTLNGYFEKVYGMTIASYARRRRIRLAQGMLEQGKSVSAAACAAGYGNPSKFAAAFKRE